MLVQNYQRFQQAQDAAGDLFDQSWFLGRIKWMLAQLLGQKRNLLSLNDLEIEPVAITRIERMSVNLDKIVGTGGRLDRFDRNFHPVTRSNRNRWIGVATAMMGDITQLPPIDVVQIGDVFYVVDGNHRVSAAKAMNKLFIDANVTRWEL